jgi:hypothetical protein
MSWTRLADDLEGLIGAWRAIAAGEEDVEIAELPELPEAPPEPELVGRLSQLQAEMVAVHEELATARAKLVDELTGLKTVRTAAGRYLSA